MPRINNDIRPIRGSTDGGAQREIQQGSISIQDFRDYSPIDLRTSNPTIADLTGYTSAGISLITDVRYNNYLVVFTGVIAITPSAAGEITFFTGLRRTINKLGTATPVMRFLGQDPAELTKVPISISGQFDTSGQSTTIEVVYAVSIGTFDYIVGTLGIMGCP